jgi:hypothetical protein
MSLPTNTIKQLDVLSTIFGGYKEIESFIPQSQLAYLGSFPGDFLVVAPWLLYQDPIDLSVIGFIPFKRFKVFNQNWDFIYSRVTSGKFGDDELDKDLIYNSYHGEYFHITFESEGITKVVLLWVAKTFDSKTKQRLLTYYQNLETTKYSRVVFNELVIQPLSSITSVDVYFIPGSWSDLLKPQDIIEHPKSTKLSFDSLSDLSNIYLQPSINYWYCFKSTDSFLRLSNISGVGIESWKDTGFFSYFFEPSLVNNARYKLSTSSLLSSTSLYNNYRLSLYAELSIPSLDTLNRLRMSTSSQSSAPTISYFSINALSDSSYSDGLAISISLSSVSLSSNSASVEAEGFRNAIIEN